MDPTFMSSLGPIGEEGDDDELATVTSKLAGVDLSGHSESILRMHQAQAADRAEEAVARGRHESGAAALQDNLQRLCLPH